MNRNLQGWILCTVLAVSCLGPHLLQAAPAVPEPPADHRLNVPQLIARMHDDGEINYSTSLKLKILWFKKWDLLPGRLKAHFDVPVGCATPVIKEIVDNYHLLSAADRKWLGDHAGLPDLKSIGARPSFSLTLQSSVIPLRVHYEETSQETRAQKTLEAYENSWQVECDQMGFFEPPGDMGVEGSDDYDVYLSGTSPGVLGYTSPESQVDGTWWNDRTSHIVHSRGLTADNEVQTTSSHEFNHACQMAMAYETIASFYENTAVWVEPHVYPEWDDDAWSYSMWYQVDPWRPVCGFDNDDIGLYQYGGFMWPEFFCERVDQWDSTVIREIWDWMRDEPGSDDHNTFDALPHFAAIYDPGGGPGGEDLTIYDLIMELSEWRYFCGQWLHDGAHYTHGQEFNQARVDAEHRHTTLPAVCPDILPNAPEFFGVNYVRFDEALTSETELTIFFSGEEEHNGYRMVWKLGIIKVFEVGGAFSYEWFDVPQDTQSLWLQVDQVGQCERLLMVVANLGNGFLNPGMNFPTKGYTYVAWPNSDPNTSMIVVGPGAGETNPCTFRSFLAESDVQFSERIHFGAYGYGVNVATGDIDGDGITEVVCGPGPDPEAPPRIRAYELNGDLVLGTNVYAYGVDKYGVNVACGDIDNDGIDEIITGPGPGAVYGPHVRGWNYDGGSLTSIPGVSYFAYGTLKYGVNVGAGDVDQDGIDEIITGAGPGNVFGAHVRGWNYDGDTLESISSINFFSWPYDGEDRVRYGANVAVGNLVP